MVSTLLQLLVEDEWKEIYKGTKSTFFSFFPETPTQGIRLKAFC